MILIQHKKLVKRHVKQIKSMPSDMNPNTHALFTTLLIYFYRADLYRNHIYKMLDFTSKGIRLSNFMSKPWIS